MRNTRSAIPLSLTLVLTSVAVAQLPQAPVEPPPGVRLLVQSELSHLEGADRRIDLEVKDASALDTLRRIERAARLTIEIEGKLPRAKKLTATFRETTVKEILTWFAIQVDVVYRADRDGKLVVFPRPEEVAK